MTPDYRAQDCLWLGSDNMVYPAHSCSRAEFAEGLLGKVVALGIVVDRGGFERLAGGVS